MNSNGYLGQSLWTGGEWKGVCLIYIDNRKWKCMIYVDDWVGVKIYADETMGLLDEKGLEGVAMTARGNLNNKERLLWW